MILFFGVIRQKKRAEEEEEDMRIQNWFCVFFGVFRKKKSGVQEKKKEKSWFCVGCRQKKRAEAEEEEEVESCRVFVWSKFVFIGRNSTSFCCLWISREEDQHPGGTDESRRRFLFFWIVTMRVRTRTLVDRRGRASYDCVINSGTEMAEIFRNFLR